MERKKNYIENRCVVFGAEIVKFTDALPNTKAGNHLGLQSLRSGTASASHYGEVQGAGSPKDFIHKMHNALKELRGSKNKMPILAMAGLMDLSTPGQEQLLKECSELVAIFSASVKTRERNNPRRK